MRFASFALLSLISLAAPMLAQSPGVPTTLAALRYSQRPLLIFAASPDDPQLQIQLRTLQQHAQDVAERDVAVIALPFRTPSPTASTLTEADAEIARHRFNVAPTDFTVILLGKDGGEKLRSRKPLTIDKLRDIIDAMPGRQDEIKGNR